MTALIVREVGKPWEDADAEVCEAIDFLRYYALGARRLGDELIQMARASNSSACAPAAGRRHQPVELPALDPARNDPPPRS